jgi:serine/threonine-protein kinase
MASLVGQTLGRYHLLEQLGEGGMASVYRAEDPRLGREVAVKVIRADYDQDPAFLKRFEREAHTLAQLTHPHIVRVLDAGEQDGLPYVVMDYVPGGTLRKRTGRPMPAAEAGHLVLPIARALDHAHRHGIVHRDVKPANILIAQDGRPMLSDFGIARVSSSHPQTQLTATGYGVGTPDYMAPEQWAGEATPASDVYALGIVLYELITGWRPFQADTPGAILLKRIQEPLPPPRQCAPGLSTAMEQVLVKALAKRPQDRFPTMGAFADALEGALRMPAGRKRPALVAWLVGASATCVLASVLVAGAGVMIGQLAGARPTATRVTPPAAAQAMTTSTGTPASTATTVTATATAPATPTTTATATVSDGGGGLIAFYSNRAGSNDIYVMDYDGANVRQLTFDAGDSRLPGWSRDGHRIAYQSNVNGIFQILVLSLDTGTSEQITRDACNHYNPVWSIDNRLAYYSDCDGNREIYTMRADGSGVTQLTTTTDVYNWFPFWSPDGTRITFSSNREGARYQVFVMNADGSNPVALARGCVSAYSPDGSQIVFSSYCDGSGDILVMDAQGGRIVNLTRGEGENANPCWSRDGTRIVFQSTRGGGTNLYAIDPDGRNLQALTTGGDLNAAPVWQP